MLTLLLVSLFAQAPTVTVVTPPNVPFQLAWQGGAADSWRLWCDGAIVYNFKPIDLKITPRADGDVDVVAIVPNGLSKPATGVTRVCEIDATNQFYQDLQLTDVKSDSASVFIGTPPQKPLGVTFIVKVGG